METRRLPRSCLPRALNVAFVLLLALGLSKWTPVVESGAIPKAETKPHKPIDIKLSDEKHFDEAHEHNAGISLAGRRDFAGRFCNCIYVAVFNVGLQLCVSKLLLKIVTFKRDRSWSVLFHILPRKKMYLPSVCSSLKR